jgi:hypothetical protein
MSSNYTNLSYTNYKQLYEKYSDKLICPCTEITSNCSSFINISPIYHPVCSSAFVEQIQFDQLRLGKPVMVLKHDRRLSSLSYFQSLAALCELAYNTVNNDLEQFGTRTIVTTQLLNEDLLHNEINDKIKQLIRSMQTEFDRVNNIFELLLQVDQYFIGTSRYTPLIPIYQPSDGYIRVRKTKIRIF